MKHSPWILLVLIGALALPSRALAQSFAPSAERGAELLGEIGLREDQQVKSHKLLANARKQAIRSQADIQIAGIDLSLELAKENPDEKVAAQLIEKMSSSEGQRLRSQVMTWLKVRKLLTAKQRKEVARLRNLGGHNIVKSQGEFINPFESFESRERSRRSDDIENPFVQTDRRPPGLAARNARGRLKISTSSPARVFIDGKARGHAPVDVRLAVGRHRIRTVFLDGSPPKRSVIELNKSRVTRVHVKARPPASESPFNPFQ